MAADLACFLRGGSGLFIIADDRSEKRRIQRSLLRPATIADPDSARVFVRGCAKLAQEGVRIVASGGLLLSHSG